MRFIKLIFHLLINLKKNTSTGQFILFILLFLFLILIGMIALIKIAIPFTYIVI
jgi:hypothetical protein